MFRRSAFLAVVPAVAVAALLSGCSGSAASPGTSQGSGTGTGTGNGSSFAQCLKKHGVSLPGGAPGGGAPGGGAPGGGAPPSAFPRGTPGSGGGGLPGGQISQAMRNAIKSCGGTGGFGGPPG
jgi:hypothetical protein